MDIRLGNTEVKVMQVLWREGDTTASHIADVMAQETGWNANTTYTLIKRCVKKGAIERSEPKFMCHALISKEEVQKTELDDLVNRLFDRSVNNLFAALLGSESISDGQIEKLKRIVEEWE